MEKILSYVKRRDVPRVSSLHHRPVSWPGDGLPALGQLTRSPRAVTQAVPRPYEPVPARLSPTLRPRVQRGDRGIVTGSEERRGLQRILPKFCSVLRCSIDPIREISPAIRTREVTLQCN